ncbi:unnamed protein product [Acanthoscelides obtectus]|uniref:Uncharacterized protein n=1 Tax=Acanthoscelides obtectus TaxID=200917 RepID=A0A9P0Q495_ACAOB|nr:unnamed protein product [Acanthoscelides obtectus]CAK1678353.1 hypothetical protein AOBTE_LOCUS31835 [Acanthoscelides obtectus]
MFSFADLPFNVSNKEENSNSTSARMGSNVLDLSKPGAPPYPPQTQSPAPSTKEKARAKAASGSKSITSFFKKS